MAVKPLGYEIFPNRLLYASIDDIRFIYSRRVKLYTVLITHYRVFYYTLPRRLQPCSFEVHQIYCAVNFNHRNVIEEDSKCVLNKALFY